MANDPVQLYWIYAVFGFLTLIAGFYCILISRNLLRALIGIEILIKSVTFFLILAGYIGGKTSLAQGVVITLIIIEVVVIAVAAGIVLGVFQLNDSLDARKLKNLKG
jgi:NADH:ubiquinone oxidoreductase subunit K